MLVNFEKYTQQLNKDELELVSIVIKGLSQRVGKDNAISSTVICQKLSLQGVRLRKIINYIRTKNLLIGLCSCGTGYYIAKNRYEFEQYLYSLGQRIEAQQFVYKTL